MEMETKKKQNKQTWTVTESIKLPIEQILMRLGNEFQ